MRYWYKKSDIEYGPIRPEDLVKIIDLNTEICDELKQWQKAYYFPDILSKLSNNASDPYSRKRQRRSSEI